MSRHPEELSISGFDSEAHVFAWKYDLQEVLIVQKAVSITIIEVNKFLTIALGVLEDVVIAKELEDVCPVDVFFSSSVNPHESTIW